MSTTKQVLQQKIDEAKKSLKETIEKDPSGRVFNEQLLEELTETLTRKLEEKLVIVEEVQKLNEELNNIKNNNSELKHKNEELTINIQEATSEIEQLTTALEESEQKRLDEVEALEEQNAQLLEELDLANVKLEMNKILEENVHLRIFSNKLEKCTSLRELREKVEILEDLCIEDDSRSVSRILKDIQEAKSKGSSNISSLQEHTKRLTSEQRIQKYLAGQIKESELTPEEKKELETR